MSTQLPLILSPTELAQQIDNPNLLIIDLSKKENHDKAHIAGAIHFDYAHIIRSIKPIMGLLPDINELNRVLSMVGINDTMTIVAYDDEGGGKAARLLWTLDLLKHPASSLLDGGMFSWVNEGHPTSHEPTIPVPTESHYTLHEEGIASQDYIVNHLNDSNVKFLDSRSPEEFAGSKVFANHGGHIPGAINMDWMLTIDKSNNMRLLNDDKLKDLLESKGLNKNQQIIVYCQTHHRSSHTYVVLKHLGYTNLMGYPGAWSDWGNSETTPKEV
ncbi:Thiosulfate sulfurtransferase, rhodanese [hydrothermal vent metagenome]|uniref:Thiosulfate sulfurtransferase, rhodanese n=1 Tax=hydrothermal vent metagenome TaxID=652676 RepID=A0A3B0YBK0_9ZZZZ